MAASDLVLLNGIVHTMDQAKPRASAVAISGKRIQAVGDEEVRDLAGPMTRILDLEGRCVIPGLADSHIHFAHFALTLRQVNLVGTTSLREAMERVAARVSQTPEGEWVQGHGWDQERWAERRFPTAIDLDAVAHQHPVTLMAKSGHAAVANSTALRLAGIDEHTVDPAGGRIERSSDGQPTGLLFDAAMRLLYDAIPRPDSGQLAAILPEAMGRAQKLGLTALHDMDDVVAFDAYQCLHAEGRLGLRIVKYVQAAELEHVLALHLRGGFGDDWLRLGGIKVMSDGALGPRTAAMLDPYLGEPENHGLLIYTLEELTDIVCRAAAGGLSVAIHAIGDRANRVALDALAAVTAFPRLRHRIEHVQLLAPEDVGRLAKLGIVASMQPLHATQDAPMAERYWGQRCQYAYAWRSLLEAGTILAFGSDCPVEDLNPFLGLQAAVGRFSAELRPAGKAWYPEQRLIAQEALRAYTWGASYAAGMEDRLGSLTPGKLADLVVLDRDILTVEPQAIGETKVLATIIGGQVVMSDGL